MTAWENTLSRGFTDALTRLIENVVRHRKDLDRYEARWIEAREAVLRERNQQADADPKDIVAGLVGAMNEAQLRDLLQRLPVAAVWRALEAQTAGLAPAPEVGASGGERTPSPSALFRSVALAL